MKKLVIVESPTKVKSIAKFLGSEYTVKASMGHVRDLPSSKFGVDIEDNFKPHYIVPQKSKSLVSALKKEAESAEVLYLAPDPDREGEAIAWHLKELLVKDKKIKVWRVAFNEITEDAIKNAFLHPKRIDEAKVQSQQARRILDRIVGYKISPLLWKKIKGGLSAGRVQSVALRLVCEREEEIQNFKPEEYWSIEAKLYPKERPAEEFIARLEKLDDKKIKLKNEEETKRILERLKGIEKYVVLKIEKKKKQRHPVPPFTTSLLQQAAINQLGFTAYKTMLVAQQLYEGIELGEGGSQGLITYMRTDSYRISRDAQSEIRSYINEKFGARYLPPKPPIYKSRKRTQEAHEAIRPTSLRFTPESVRQYLSNDQQKLYTLIWKRAIASQMANAEFAVTKVTINADNAVFTASGTEMIFPGFLAVYEISSEEEANLLPSLKENDELLLKELLPEQHFTKPPPPYTEASLVKALEEKNIGRPSTYAPIVYTIVKRNYVTKEDGKLHPTELGKIVTDMLVASFPDIMDVEFTARMEDELDEIENGKLLWNEVLGGFYKPFIKELLIAEEKLKKVVIKPIVTENKCPKCEKFLVIRQGRFGRFLACSGFPACKHTESLATEVKCPKFECGGVLVHRRSRKGKVFYGCSNYPKCTFTTVSLSRLSSKEEKIAE